MIASSEWWFSAIFFPFMVSTKVATLGSLITSSTIGFSGKELNFLENTANWISVKSCCSWSKRIADQSPGIRGKFGGNSTNWYPAVILISILRFEATNWPKGEIQNTLAGFCWSIKKNRVFFTEQILHVYEAGAAEADMKDC